MINNDPIDDKYWLLLCILNCSNDSEKEVNARWLKTSCGEIDGVFKPTEHVRQKSYGLTLRVVVRGVTQMERNSETQSLESTNEHQKKPVPVLSRRGFLKKATVTGIAGIGGITTASGMASARRRWPTYSPADGGHVYRDVFTIQFLVKWWEDLASLAYDGYYGPQTEAAVRDFQFNQGLKVDGIVGPNTWDALARLAPYLYVNPADYAHGWHVVAVQDQLHYGPPKFEWVNVDGIYGPETGRAVNIIKNWWGLPDDRVAGHNTWRELVGRGVDG